MACVDYPEVECYICKQKWHDGYIVVKGKAICELCLKIIKEADK